MNPSPPNPLPPLKEAPVLGSVPFAEQQLAQWDARSGIEPNERGADESVIREEGIVVALVAGGVIVETQRQSGCQSCASRGGCGVGLIQKALNRKQHQVTALTALPVQIGDRVRLVLPAAALVQASLLMYLFPLLGLMIGALCGQVLMSSNSAAILGGALGFGLSLLWIARRQNGLSLSGRYAPRIERLE
ncbi:MAG: SoxR reducing system RseC family protein [Halothiobacillus sp.]